MKDRAGFFAKVIVGLYFFDFLGWAVIVLLQNEPSVLPKLIDTWMLNPLGVGVVALFLSFLVVIMLKEKFWAALVLSVLIFVCFVLEMVYFYTILTNTYLS